VTAEIEVPRDGASGVIIAQGGAMGGWALYTYEGALKYTYTFLGVQHTTVGAASALLAGEHQVRMEFTYDGGGIGKGAAIALFVDGKPVGQGRVKRTHALFYSMDETLEVGCDMGEPVNEEYGHGHDNAFNGRIHWVRIDVDAAAKDADHMIGAEERFMVVMARQ
jgi:arylsulfatase